VHKLDAHPVRRGNVGDARGRTPANHPLCSLDNILITPSTAGPTWENWGKAFRNAFDNIQRVAAGSQPMWVIPELHQPSL
jgi:phosphoglycerate dehydrogenase-like enzyme